jgi:hypothetical protein
MVAMDRISNNDSEWFERIRPRLIAGTRLYDAIERMPGDQAAARVMEQAAQHRELDRLHAAHFGYRKMGENAGATVTVLGMGLFALGPWGWFAKLISVPVAISGVEVCQTKGAEWSDAAVEAEITAINEARQDRFYSYSQ